MLVTPAIRSVVVQLFPHSNQTVRRTEWRQSAVEGRKPADSILSIMHQAQVDVFSDSVWCLGNNAMSGASNKQKQQVVRRYFSLHSLAAAKKEVSSTEDVVGNSFHQKRTFAESFSWA